jgi:hypothetical protein
LINNALYAPLVSMGQTYAFANYASGRPSSTLPRLLSEAPTDKGCWLPRDSPHRAVECGLTPVAMPNPTPAPFLFFPTLNQFVFQRAGLAFQTALTASQGKLISLMGATGALLQADITPCTAERATAKGAVAVALQGLQGGLGLLATLSAGSPAFMQQLQVVSGLTNVFVQKLQLYFAEGACGGVGLGALGMVQYAAVQALVEFSGAAQLAAAAQVNFMAEGQICGCACGVNCPAPQPAFAAASIAASTIVQTTHKTTHEHSDFRITAEAVMNGRSNVNVYID